jgi:cysteine synthase
MSIRIDFQHEEDAQYVAEVGLAEKVGDLVDEIVERKPAEKDLVPTMAAILSDSTARHADPQPAKVQAGKFIQRIGNTPLVEVPSPNPQVKIYAKCEQMNPTGSIKDRIADHILNTAEADGKLTRGSGQLVVAASSGNTASAIAMQCAVRGYKCKIFTNTKCSKEKVDSVKAYGGDIIVGPSGKPADSPEHYQNLAVAAAAASPGAYDVDQYDNPANPEAYYNSLGPEIWEQTAGTVTHFVAAGSTGGTISGVGRYLKEKTDGACEVVLADPHGSCFSDYYLRGEHDGASSFLIEGVGKDSIPGAMNFAYVDWALQISDAQALKVCHEMAQGEGMWIGGSSGLNIAAAQEMAKKMDKPGVIVTIIPDHGLKYLSKYYNSEWLSQQGVELSPDGIPACTGKRYKDALFHGPETKHESLRSTA